MEAGAPALHLLHTNNVPGPDEYLQIKAYLYDPLHQVLDLDKRIALLQAEINVLSHERSQILKHVEPHLALISPTRRLPVDILQEIFLRCLPAQHNAVMDATEAPLLLGRICSTWRRISQSTPRLWSSLHIPEISFMCEGDDDRISYLTDIVKEWLARSGNCPLSISLVDSDAGSPFLQTILLYCSRWQHIDLTLDDWSSPVITLLPEQVPKLESLKIDNTIYIHNLEGQDWTSIPVFLAPNLRRIRIRHPQGTFIISATQIRWEALVELHIHKEVSSTPLTGISDVLRASKNLIDCSLVFDTYSDSGERLEPIELLRLMTFSIKGSGDMSRLFDSLCTPALYSFEFDYAGKGPNSMQVKDLPYAISRFLSRITALKHLAVEARFFTSEELLACLKFTPYLSHLEIKTQNSESRWTLEKEPCGDSFLERLIVKQEYHEESLCPYVEHFFCNRNTFSDEVVSSFVSHKTSLQTVEIYFDREHIDGLTYFTPTIPGCGSKVTLHYAPSANVFPWIQANPWYYSQ